MLFNQTNESWLALKGADTAREISQQPSTWKKTADIIKHQKQEIQAFISNVTEHADYKVIFTGAGTSEFVGNALVPLFLKKGSDHFFSIASTDLVATPDLYIRANQPTLLVSFGRSGNSPESIGAIDVANALNPNTYHLVITCNKEGSLARRAGSQYFSIELPDETNDLSFAMTSSFTNMFLAAYMCFNIDEEIIEDDALSALTSCASEILEVHYPAIKAIVDTFDFKRIVYLGDGRLNGIAQESALKMLELTAGEVVTMFDTPLGFRHGPKSIINADTLTVIYLSKDAYTRNYQVDLIKEISAQRKGNRLVAVDCKYDAVIESCVDTYISLDLDASIVDLMGICYVLFGQILALYRSVSLGKSPDNPWPSGMVNRVVKGVELYPYHREGKNI